MPVRPRRKPKQRHDPIAVAASTPDEPFCGQLDDHDCGGASCRRRPRVRDLGHAGGQGEGRDDA